MFRNVRFLRAWRAAVALVLSHCVSAGVQLSHGQDIKENDLSGSLRRLLVDAGPGAKAEASITIVNTASQLQAAAVSMAQDIEIRSHLDLTNLGLVAGYNDSYIPSALGAIVATRSIRGNCTEPPAALSEFGLSGPDFQWQSPQCVLVCDHDTLYLWSNIWLDALYIRPKPSQFFLYFAIIPGEDAVVYGSRLTIQGDGRWNTSSILAKHGSRVYIQDSLFLDVGGETQTVAAANASVVLNRTTFTNVVQQRAPIDFQPATVDGPESGQYLANGVLVAEEDTSSLIVQDCVFENVTAVNMFWKHNQGYIAAGSNTGAPDTAYDLLLKEDVPVSALGPVPASRLQPLRPDDEWWVTVRNRLANADAASYLPEAQPPPDVPPEPEAPVSGTALPQIAAVYTPEDFQRAFQAGVRDIELRAHMDMRLVDKQDSRVLGGKQSVRLGEVKPTTRSIRGYCTSPPPEQLELGAGGTILSPEPWAAPRCVIVVTERAFTVDTAHVWVDSVHLQIVNPSSSLTVAFWLFSSAALFLTNSVVQGDAEPGIVGLEASNCRRGAYVRRTVFNELQGSDSFQIPVLAYYSPVHFDSCTLRHLAVPSDPGPIEAGTNLYAAVQAIGINATLALQNTTLSDVQSNYSLGLQAGAEFYSDSPLQTAIMSYKREIRTPKPLSALAGRAGRAGPPLTASDPWFVALQQTLADPSADAYLSTFPVPEVEPTVTTPSTGVALSPGIAPAPVLPGGAAETVADDEESATVERAPDDSGGMSTGAIIGIVAAVVVVVAAVVALLLIGFRKTKKPDTGGALEAATAPPPPIVDPGLSKPGSMPAQHPQQAPPAFAGPNPHYGAPYGPLGYGAAPHMHVRWGPHAYQAAAGHRSRGPGAAAARGGLVAPQMSVNSAPTATMTAITQSTWSDFQKAAGGAGTPVEELEVALDAMCGMQAPFYSRYSLLSAVDRRLGGQGVVQFASIANTQDQVAIKFYLHREAFRRERQLYTESQLKAMMPATLAVEENASGECRTPYGYVFPPFVIIERGQSLDEFARDNVVDSQIDFVTVFQALSHAVRALRDLHSFGYAHRDIKPGNILRRPKQHDWTLIDFGCAAEIGSRTGLSFSLKYAAPEVIHALEAGSRTIVADAAVDIWAIGVIAFELLAGERAFPAHSMSAEESEAAAQAAVAGRVPLPWEGGSEEAQARLGKLRGMRRTVLRCLERDPAKRPTAEALLRSWDHTFDNMHTRGTEWSAESG